MKSYTNFIFKRRKLLFVLFLVVNISAILGIFAIKLNTDFGLFTTNNSVYQDRLDAMEENFGNVQQIVVMLESDQFDENVLTDLSEIQIRLFNITNVTYVEGPAPDTMFLNGETVVTTTVDPEMLLAYYSNLQEYSPIQVVDGTYYYVYTLFVTEDFGKTDVSALETALGKYDYPSYVSGELYNQAKIVDYVLQILIYLPPLTILLVLFVFFLQIGAIKPTLFSVLPAGIGALWTLGLIGLFGNEVSILTAIVPVLVIVIGSADGLHFMTHYQDAIKSGLSEQTAIEKTLHVVGIPMIITTLTSMAGFLSLLSMGTSSTVDLALFATLGIFLAGVATWFALPLILSGGPNVLPKRQSKMHQNVSGFLKKLWGIPSIAIALVLVALGATFAGSISHEFDMLSIYKDSTEVAKSAKKIQSVVGGSIPIYIEIDMDSTLLSYDSYLQVSALTDQLLAMPEVDHIVSPYQLFDYLIAAQTNQDITTDLQVQTAYYAIRNQSIEMISKMMDVHDNRLRVLVFPVNQENDTLGTIENAVNDSSLTTSVSGVQYLLRDLNTQIGVMQLESIAIALVVVFLMLAISLQSIKTAFLGVLPMISTVASIYFFMGVTGIPLNITTVIIFSIAIGVGVDYAVHYASVYRMYWRETKDNVLSIEQSFHQVGRPVIANALGIAIGLTVLVFSPLTIHRNVSILMWVGMMTSVFVTLTLLPTLFKYFPPRKKGHRPLQ